MKKKLKGSLGSPQTKPRKNASFPAAKNATSTSSLGFFGTLISWINTAGIIAIIAGIIYATYVGYNLLLAYLLSKKVDPIITILYPHPPAVGQTLTCRIRFRSKEGKLIPFSSKIFQQLKDHLNIVLLSDGKEQSIRVLQEVFPAKNHILGKFSVRESGTYEMRIKYRGWFYLTTSTSNEEKRVTFDIVPGLPSLKNTDFGTHNPQILCVRANSRHYMKITAKDEYGNNCRVQDLDFSKFSFDLHHMGVRISVDHKFGLHEPTQDLGQQKCACSIDEDDEENENSRFGYELCLKLRLREPAIYQCSLKYEKFRVRQIPENSKLLVCMTPLEEVELGCLFSERRFPGSFIYTCECKAFKVGTFDRGIEGYVGLSASTLAFAKFTLALQLYPTYTFPINGRTKLVFHESKYEFGEVEVSLIVQDGLRQSIQLNMEPSSARKLLVSFAHTQGFIFPKLAITFSEKRDQLKSKLEKNFFESWFTSDKILRVQHGNLIKSTLSQAPRAREDWLLPFKIYFEAGGPPKLTTTADWLNRLCMELFTPNDESGMFHYLPGSRLLHPRASGFSRQPLVHYRLAGQILAKCIVETLLRKVCANFSDVRFTRSTLTYLLGFPVHYKSLETDEPNYFDLLIKPILESDVGENKKYTFTTLPETPSDTKVVNLIHDGSKIAVTNENKEYYLNMLAHHRLIHPVAEELKEMRSGFYDVISMDYLCDLNEDDLEMLICGGCPFIVSDLMAHHRVIKEFHDEVLNPYLRPPMNASKVLSWFWTATANMSEKEKSNLVFFTTGNFSLPACGFGALNPKFCISLIGSFNQPPKANPSNHEIILSDHISFDNFEKTLLETITPMTDRVILPTKVDHGLASYHLETLLKEDVGEEELEMDDIDEKPSHPETQPGADSNGNGQQGESTTPRVPDTWLVPWLKSFANL